MLAVTSSKHAIFLSMFFSLFLFSFYDLVSSFRVNFGLDWVRVGARDHDFVFFMKTTKHCCLNWHRPLQMALAVTDGIDRYRWH